MALPVEGRSERGDPWGPFQCKPFQCPSWGPFQWFYELNSVKSEQETLDLAQNLKKKPPWKFTNFTDYCGENQIEKNMDRKRRKKSKEKGKIRKKQDFLWNIFTFGVIFSKSQLSAEITYTKKQTTDIDSKLERVFHQLLRHINLKLISKVDQNISFFISLNLNRSLDRKVSEIQSRYALCVWERQRQFICFIKNYVRDSNQALTCEVKTDVSTHKKLFAKMLEVLFFFQCKMKINSHILRFCRGKQKPPEKVFFSPHHFGYITSKNLTTTEMASVAKPVLHWMAFSNVLLGSTQQRHFLLKVIKQKQWKEEEDGGSRLCQAALCSPPTEAEQLFWPQKFPLDLHWSKLVENSLQK